MQCFKPHSTEAESKIPDLDTVLHMVLFFSVCAILHNAARKETLKSRIVWDIRWWKELVIFTLSKERSFKYKDALEL